MKRSEFNEKIRTVSDVMDLVCDEELWDYFDDIHDEEQTIDAIWDDIRDFEGSWEGLRDVLNEIDDVGRYDYYVIDGAFSYNGLGENDAEWMKERLYAALSDYDYWEEESEEDQDLEDDEDMEVDESIDFGGLYTACSGKVNVLITEDKKNKREEYIEFTNAIHSLI